MALSLMDFGERTRLVVNRQMIKFHLAFMYLTYAFSEDIGKMAYTDDMPKIQRSFLTTSGYTSLASSFFTAYRQWLQEMAMNKRQFAPFNLYTRELFDSLTDIAPVTGFLKSKISYKTMQEALNTDLWICSTALPRKSSTRSTTQSFRTWTRYYHIIRKATARTGSR